MSVRTGSASKSVKNNSCGSFYLCMVIVSGAWTCWFAAVGTGAGKRNGQTGVRTCSARKRFTREPNSLTVSLFVLEDTQVEGTQVQWLTAGLHLPVCQTGPREPGAHGRERAAAPARPSPRPDSGGSPPLHRGSPGTPPSREDNGHPVADQALHEDEFVGREGSHHRGFG